MPRGLPLRGPEGRLGRLLPGLEGQIPTGRLLRRPIRSFPAGFRGSPSRPPPEEDPDEEQQRQQSEEETSRHGPNIRSNACRFCKSVCTDQEGRDTLCTPDPQPACLSDSEPAGYAPKAPPVPLKACSLRGKGIAKADPSDAAVHASIRDRGAPQAGLADLQTVGSKVAPEILPLSDPGQDRRLRDPKNPDHPKSTGPPDTKTRTVPIDPETITVVEAPVVSPSVGPKDHSREISNIPQETSGLPSP